MSSLFSDTPQPRIRPRTKDEWLQLEVAISHNFSPFQPIDDRELFVGRIDLLRRMIDTVFQSGRHAILYGERGVGKSSLANALRDTIPRVSQHTLVEKLQCNSRQNFRSIWKAVFDKYMIDGQTSDIYLSESPDPYEIYQVIQHIRGNTKRFVVILDEFDEVADIGSKIAISETIKTLSDNDGNSTIILVGVARSIREIFEGHESLPRSMQQVPMPVMSEDELHSILNSRLNLLGMTMEDAVRRGVVTMSQGFPNYTHGDAHMPEVGAPRIH
jgi:Cdc6-like AAA superfamily ATPase